MRAPLLALLAAAEPNIYGELEMPVDLHEVRFSNLDSGLFGELLDDSDEPVWRSRSSLGLDVPYGAVPAFGTHQFSRVFLEDGTPLMALSLAVEWELSDGDLRPYTFNVAESLDSFNAQLARFRRQLFGWFAAVALIMLLSISVLLRHLLRPLRQIENEIGEIEQGERASLSARFPTELTGVARNMNLLIDSERGRSERYRNTLDNLAHSLKTPLAAIRSLLDQGEAGKVAGKVNEQIDRMDEIVRYQLRKPANLQAKNLVLVHVPVASEIDRLVAGLSKVYHDKSPHIESVIDDDMEFRGDSGDFLEVAGNLLDNACKWCERRVRITIRYPGEGDGRSGMVLCVEDDGQGIPANAVDALLQRGTRLDESTPGHGIGLAVVKEIAESYGGKLEIADSELGGAKICVRVSASSQD